MIRSFAIRAVAYGAALLGLGTSSALAASCEDISPGETLGVATILRAQQVTGGTFVDGGTRYEGLPRFCRVVARAKPALDSNIVIELWMPDPATWNGKFMGTGNGGYAGAIRYEVLMGGLKRGYAVANTDMGTYPAALGMNYGAGNGRADPASDWGFRATHEMTVLSKALVARFYGASARRNYFVGCSTGGRQGFIEAQRYPEDYDAILAGAPAYNSTRLHASWTHMDIAARAPGAQLSADALRVWQEALANSCAGKDGGAPGDAYLNSPLQCPVTPRSLRCKQGQAASCLEEGQVKALEAIHGGMRNPRTGELIYPGYVAGVDVARRLTNPNIAAEPVTEDFHRWVFGPKWKAASFDFDLDMDRVDQALGVVVNAMNPNLARFAERGGKLIVYHGWQDELVSPIDSLMYFDRLTGGSKRKAEFARLFMLPGVSHCAGGPGFDRIGGSPDNPIAGAEEDLIVALDRWVETGRAPETVVAAKGPSGRGVDAQPPIGPGRRLICAYPRIARYDGKGDPNRAESYSCAEAAPPQYELPAGRYLQ